MHSAHSVAAGFKSLCCAIKSHFPSGIRNLFANRRKLWNLHRFYGAQYMKALLLFLFLFPFFSYSQNISEKELGFENSSSLREEMQEKFLESNGEISISKLEDFRETLLKLFDEYKKNLASNLEAEGMAPEIALEKASKDKIIEAYQFIINRLDLLLTSELELSKAEYELKKILRIYFSLKVPADDPLLEARLKNLYSILFMGHKIPIDERKSQMPSNIPDRTRKKYFNQEELLEKIGKGEDISSIDPADGPYWKKPSDVSAAKPISSRELEQGIPTVFEFDEVTISQTRPKIKVKEILPNGKKVSWKMKFGREVNTEYVASRIMRLLGYNADTYFYVKSPRVYFKNKEAYESMINDWISHYEADDSILPDTYIKAKGEDEKGFFVDFHEGLLEDRPKEVIRLLGFHFAEMGNWERREVRAQLLVQAFLNQVDNKEFANNKTNILMTSKNPGDWEVEELIHDVGFSFGDGLSPNLPNGYTWTFLKKRGNKIVFNYKNNQFIRKDRNPFQSATYSDLKWMARYFAQIKKAQLEQIIQYSGWPDEIGRLFLEKMTTRRNEIISAFELEKEGHKLWDEVDPKKFNYKDHIYKGKLKKGYKSPTPVDYYKYNIVPFLTGDLLVSIIPQILKATQSIPYYRIVPLPVDLPGITFERFYPSLGFGVRVNRTITKNPEATSQDKNWLTHDTLELFGTIGARAYFPITQALTGKIKGQYLLGKQYSLAYYSSTPFKAALGDFKKLASLPFKKNKIINTLKPGEFYGDGVFIGLEFKEQLQFGNGIASVGVQAGQKNKFVSRTLVYKNKPEKMEVSKEKSNDFTLSFSGGAEFFEFLDLEFFSASIMLGKSKGKTYYFDMAKPGQALIFNYLVYGDKELTLLEQIPSSNSTSKYFEGAYAMGIFAALGGKTRGEWIFKTDVDGKEKRYFTYFTEFVTNNIFSGNNNNFRVSGTLEFDDDDFKTPTKRYLNAQYEVKDELTKYKEINKRLEKVNQIVGDKNFVTYTPELYTTNHVGSTYLNLSLTFGDDGLLCIFEKIGCKGEGEKAKKINRMLSRIERRDDPVKKMIRFGKILKKMMIIEERFVDLKDFIGGEKISAEFWLKGESVSDEGLIHIKRAAL